MNRKPLLQNLLLIFGSLVFTVLLAEILLRAVLPPPIVWKFPQERYLFDAETGHRLKPNQQAFTHDKAVSINSRGIRDSEYERNPDGQTTRVLALGDSQTFGNGIAQSETWPKQLERKLNEVAGAGSYEVLNAGLPSTDTWQHEILLQRLMATYDPDIVILAFYVNDVVSKPVLIRNAQSDDVDSKSRRLIYILKQSAFLLSLKTAFDAVMHSYSPQSGFLTQNALLAGESNPEIDRRWEQVEKSLAGMKAMVAENNVDLLVVSLPRRDQVDGRLSANGYNQKLSALIKRTDLRFMNLLDRLQAEYKKYGKALFIPWDGHNTGISNGAVADEIAVVIPGLTTHKSGSSGQ